MSKQKRYTAQEMREEADYCDSVAKETEEIRKIGLKDGEVISECLYRKLCNMLRQAADSEEKNAKLKSRLETVVKMLKEREYSTSCSDCGRYNGYPCADHSKCGLFKRHEEFAAILRLACGEEGASDGK